MTQGIQVPVQLYVENLQKVVSDLRSQLSHLKVGSSDFKQLENIIKRIENEMDKLQARSAKPFINESQFSAAHKSVDKIEEDLNRISTAAGRIKFSSLELDASQRTQLKTFEDQITSLRARIKGLREETKQSFLNSESGKEWLVDHPGDASRTFEQITNRIRSAVEKQNQAVQEAKATLEEYSRVVLAGQTAEKTAATKSTGKDPAALKTLLGKDFNTYFNESAKGAISFKSGENTRTLFQEWLVSNFSIDPHVVSNLVKQSAPQIAAALNDAESEIRKSLEKTIAAGKDANIKKGGATVQYDQERASLVALQTILGTANQTSKDYAITQEELSRAVEATGNNLATLQEAMAANVRTAPAWNSAIKDGKKNLNELSSVITKTNTSFLQQQRTLQNFNAIKMAIMNFMGFRQTISLVSRGTREALNHIRELDSVMNKISIVTNMSTSDLWNQVEAYSNLAQKYGTSIKGAYEVSQIYYQQGLKTNDVLTLTQETLKLSKISGLDYATTTDYMTTAIRGFKMEMSDASRVVDVYSNLAAHTAASSEEIAVAMSKTASSMESVGSTFEESSAMIATMVAVTRESATNIGSALKSIAARYGEMKKDPLALVDAEGDAMDYNKVDAALRSVGITLKDEQGQFRSMTDVVLELAEVWDQLESTQQRYIATQFAGNRQQSRFLALISNKDLLKQNLEYATNSEDTGDLQAMKALDSIEAKTEQVRVAYQQMYTTIGVEDLWGNLLDGTKNFINTLNGLPKLFGKIPIGAIAMIADIVKVIKDIGMKALSGLSGIWDKIFPIKVANQKGSEFGEGFAKGVETALQKLTNVKLLQDTGKEVNKQIVTGSKKSEDDKTHDSVKNESTVKDIAKNAVEVSSEKVAINTEVKVDNAQISEAIAQLTSTFQNLNLSDILKAELDKIDFSAVDKSGQINAFYQNLINAAGENKQALYDKFVELGLIGVGQATEEGIKAGEDGSVGAATALGQAILQALHDSINANSPSPTIIALFRNGVGDAIEIGLETSKNFVVRAATDLGKTVPEALQEALENGDKVNLVDYFEEGDAQALLEQNAKLIKSAANKKYTKLYDEHTKMLFSPDTTSQELHRTEAGIDYTLKLIDEMDAIAGRIAKVKYEGIPSDILVGTHNFNPAHLYNMAAWGGVFPSPSVAVRSAYDKPWTDFNEASMFVPKKYVDPQMGYTDLYRGDGYTRVLGYGVQTLEDAHRSYDSQPETTLSRVTDLIEYSRDATHLFNIKQAQSQLAASAKLSFGIDGYRETESRDKTRMDNTVSSILSMLQYYIQHSNFSEEANLFDYRARKRGAQETGKGAYSEALYRTIEGMTQADANSVSLNLDAVRKLFSQNLYESFSDLAKIEIPTKFQDEDASGIVDSSLELISFLLKNPGYDWLESKPRGDVPFSELAGLLAPINALSEQDYRFAFDQGLDPRRTFFYDNSKMTGPFSREAIANYMIKNVPGIAFDEHGPILEGEYNNGFDLSRTSKILTQVNPDLWEITDRIDDMVNFSSSALVEPLMNSFKAAFSNIDFESEGATAQVEDLLRNFAVTLKYNIPELEGAGINVAHQIAAGIAIGFSQELADATTAASGCGKAVIEALNSGAGVASPSVFAKVTGENIIAGLVQGLKGANQSAMAAAAESGESVIEAIEKNATMDESTFNSWKQQMIKNIQDLSTLVASEAEKQEGIDFLNNLTFDQARAGLGGPMVAKALGLFREQTLQQGQKLIPSVYSSPIEKAQWSYDNTRTRLANKYGYLTNQEDIDAARNELASAQARLKNRDQERQEKIDNSQIVKETKQKHAQESAEIFKKYEEKISEAIIPYDEQIREAKQIEAKYKEQQLKFYNKKGELKPNGGKKIDELNQQMAEELAKKGLKSSKDLEKDKAAEEDRLQREKQKELLDLQKKQKDERIEAERKAGIEVDKTLNEQKKSDQKDIDKWSRKLTLADKGPKAAFSDEENEELEEKQKKIDELQGRKRTDEEQLKSKIASSSSVTQQRVDEAAGIERLAKENADRKAAEEAEKLRQEEEARKAAEEAERLRQEEEARKAAEEAERLKQEEARKAAENERLKQEAIARSKMVPEEKAPYKYESVEPVEPRDREAFVGQVASGEGIKPVKLATWDELKDASGFEFQVQDLMAKIQTGFTGDAWANAIHGKTDEELELQAQTLSNPKRTGGNPIDFDVAFEALKRMREEATATLGAIKEVSEVSSETKEKTSTSTEQELAVLKQLKQAREQGDKAGAKEAFGSLKQMGAVSEKAVSINNATVDKYIQEREAMLATAQAAKETAAAEEEVAQAESSVAQAQEQVNASKQASDNSQSKTELETINENIAALERLAQGYQQLEASKNRSYTSNAAREEEEARINEKINSSKAILTANGVTGIDTLGSVRAALKGQQDRLPGLDQGASSLMSGYTMEDTSTDALKEKILAVTEQLTNAKVLSEESANSIRENLDNASPEKLKQELTELENKLQQVASESPGIGAKLKQAFTSGGLSSFGAALSTISALFDKTTRGGQMAAGAITALGGAMRVVDGISKAMAGQNPWMALAMGVMAVINGISIFIEDDKERLERLTKEAEEYSNKAKQAKADTREIEAGKKKLDELAEKRYESAESAEEYQNAVDDLTSKFPRLIAGFDESGNAILDAAEMEKMLTETRQKSAKATYEAALKEYEANKEKERQAKKKVSNELSGITNDFATENQMISEERAKAGASALSSFIRRKSSISNDTYDDIIRLYKDQNTYGIAGSSRGELLEQLRTSETNKNTGIGKILSQYDNLTNADDTVIEEILTQFEAAFGGKNAKAEDKQALHFLRGILTGNYSTEGIDAEFEGKTDIDSLWEKASALYYSVQTHNANDTLGSPEGKGAYNGMITTLKSLEQLGETRATEILSELNGEGGVTALLDAYYDSCADTLSDVTTIVSAGIRTLNQDSTYLNSNALTAMVTKAVTSNLDLSEMSRENADKFIKNADTYSENVETWYRLLSDEQRTLFDKMYADPSKYTIEDIENAFKDTKGFDVIKTLLNSSSNAEQQETRRTQLVSNLKTIAQSDILTKYQNFIQDTNNSFSNSEQSLLNKAIDQVISLQSSGLKNQADEFGTAFLNLYSDIQELEPQLQAALIQQFINNGVKTREGIQKTLDYIKGTEGYESLNTDGLEAAVSEWSKNIALTMQTYLADVQEKWKDQSKVFKNLREGIDFTEIADVMKTAKNQGITLKESDFLEDGDKFILAEEAYDTYIAEYFNKQSEKSQGMLESLEASWKTLRYSDDLVKEDHILTEPEIKQLQEVLGGDYDNWVKTTDQGQMLKNSGADFYEALLAGYENGRNAIIDYDTWLARAQKYLKKSQDRKNGIYDFTGTEMEGWDILSMMELSTTAIHEIVSPDIKNAIKQARSATSSLLSDLITKGLKEIDFDDYEGLPTEIRESIVSDLSTFGLFEVTRKYANMLGNSLADTNKLVLQAYEKQNNIGKYSSDAIKDLQFINESQFTVTSSELESLAEKYDLNLGDLLEQGLINYSNELGEYVVNWTEIDSLTEDLYQVEGFKETIEESINTYLKKIASSINDALSGTLSLENKKELLKFAESHGIQLNTNDFTRTADGFRLSEKAAISLYNQVKKVDALAAQITFDKLKESLIATNDEYKTASSNLEHIRELNEKIIEANAKGDNTRANQYREELELAEKIYAIRSTSEDSSFNFMSGKIPGGQNNPINYYNNWATAFQKINEALKTRSVTHDRDTGKAIQHQGLIDYQDWYNIVMEMNNLASKTAPIILSDAIKLDGTLEAAAKLIEKGAAALTLDSNNQIKVALGDIAGLGIDFKTGAKDLATNLDAAISSYAQSQVDMLDSMIALLEVIVAMEALGDLDVDEDMEISVPEIVLTDKDGKMTGLDETGTWITKYSEKYNTIREDLVARFAKDDGTHGILDQITANGHTMTEILDADENALRGMGIKAKDLSKLLTNFYKMVNSDAFDQDNPWGSFLEIFAGQDWGDLVIGANAGNHQILLSNEGTYSFDYTSDAAIERIKKALPEWQDKSKEDIIAQVQAAIDAKNAGDELNIEQNYILHVLTGNIKVIYDKDGKPSSYKVGEKTYNSMKDAAAAGSILGLDSDGEFEVNDGIATGSIHLTDREIIVTADETGKVIYKVEGKKSYEGSDREAAYQAAYESMTGKTATEDKPNGITGTTDEYEEWLYKQGLKVSPKISIEGQGVDLQNNPEARAQIEELRSKTDSELEDMLKETQKNKQGKYTLDLGGVQVNLSEEDFTVNGKFSAEKLRATLAQQLGLDQALAGTITEGVQNAFKDGIELKVSKDTTVADIEAIQEAINDLKQENPVEISVQEAADNNTSKVQAAIDGIKDGVAYVDIYERYHSAKKHEEGHENASTNDSGFLDISKYSVAGTTGTLGLAKAQGTLMGELGPELVVSNGRYFVAGQNGPEMVDLADDAIVFNHLQTKSLLEKGMSSGRGRAVTNEYNAVSFAKGNINGGPAMASASSILGTLRQLRAQWQALAGMSASDLAKKGGGGGGGGGKTPFIKELERWYNWLQKIAQLEREINLEEAKRSKYATSFSRNGGDYARSQKTTLDNLKQEVAIQKNLNDEQEKYLKDRIEKANNDGSPWRLLYSFSPEGAFQYDKEGYAWLSDLFGTDEHGKPKYTAKEQVEAILAKSDKFADYMLYDESGNKLDTTGDDWYATALQNFTNFMDSDKEEFESLAETVNEGKISVEKLEQQRNEILKEMEDNQIEVEQKVLKAVEESRQREIDELQKQRDAIEKGNQALIEGLNNQLQKEQEMYNQQQETDELSKLQRQLAILQRTGGSAASIADLQDQIADKQQSMYFEAQQQEIDALQEASDNQLERLDHQIDIMQEELDYEKENGLLWNAVYDVLSTSPENIMNFIKTNTEEYWNKSPTEMAKAMRDDLFTIDKFKELQVYGGMEALIAMYNDSKDDEAAAEEKKKTDEEEAAAAATGGDTSVDTSGGNKPTPTSTQTKYKATLTGKTVTGKSFTVSGTGVGNNATAAQRTALQYAANKVPKDASYTSMPAYEKVYATGGLVKQPTYALIGEEGEEGILNAAQTEYLRNKLMSSRPDSFVSAVDDFFASLDADKTALQAIANFNGALDNQASITIEHAAVNLQVDKLANDYDAKRAANTIMQEMLHIASKSASNNSVGR